MLSVKVNKQLSVPEFSTLIAPRPSESSALCQHCPWRSLLSPVTIKIRHSREEVKTRRCSLNGHRRRHVCILTAAGCQPRYFSCV